MELGCLGGFIWLSYGKNKINLLHQGEGLVFCKHNHCCLLLLLGELVDIFQSKYFPLSLQLMSFSFLPSSSSSPSLWQVLFFFKQFMHFHFYVFLKGQQTPKHVSLPFWRWAVSINIKNFSLSCVYFIYSHPFSHCFPLSWTCQNGSNRQRANASSPLESWKHPTEPGRANNLCFPG